MKSIITKTVITFLIVNFQLSIINAQISINEDGSNPDASAILDVKSTDKGILIPRMDGSARNNISNPATGLMVFDTTTSSFWYFSNTWIEISSSNLTKLEDTDSDTKIQVEESNDEDIIRFDLGGTEYFRFEKGRIEFANSGSSIFLGQNAGANDDFTSNQNTLIGYYAGWSNETSLANVAIGTYAQAKHTSGDFSTSVGAYSMRYHQSGANNVAVGGYTLTDNVDGTNNTAIGTYAMTYDTSGSSNVAIGTSALYNSKDVSENVAIGRRVGYNATGNSNIFLGYRSGYNATGDANVFLGYRTGYNSTKSNSLYIDNTDTESPLIYGEFDNDLLQINGALSIKGLYNFPMVDGLVNQVLVTDGNGTLAWANDTDNQTIDTLRLDGNKLELSITNDNQIAQSIDLSGYLDNTDSQELTLSNNILSISNATNVVDLTNYLDNQTIDKLALNGNTLELSLDNDGQSDYTLDLSSITSTTLADTDNDTKIQVEESNDDDIIRFDIGGSERFRFSRGRIQFEGSGASVFIGEEAGADDDFGGNENVYIGYYTGNSNVSSGANIGIGRSSQANHTSGNFTTSIGNYSMRSHESGSNNAAFGGYSLANNVDGGENTAIGTGAMRYDTTGDNNVSLGAFSLYNGEGYSKNVVIGAFAGYNATGSSNVFIGYKSGYSATTSNSLYIDNSNTSSPLIYGEFDNNLLQVNGSLNINNQYTLPTTDGTDGQVLKTDGAGNLTWVDEEVTPIGTIQMWATSTPPTGWLICDGSTFNASTYAELNTVLGGNTLPDFAGRFPLGVGNSGENGSTNHSLGQKDGEETHQLTISEMPAHSHGISYNSRSKGGSGNNVSDLTGSGNSASTDSVGGSQAHNNMPPFYTVNFIIKAE